MNLDYPQKVAHLFYELFQKGELLREDHPNYLVYSVMNWLTRTF